MNNPYLNNGGLSFGLPSGAVAPVTAGDLSFGVPNLPKMTSYASAAPAVAGNTPGEEAGWFKSTFFNPEANGGGLNLKAVGNAASVVGSLGKMIAGFQANKIARDTLAFQKDAYNTNLSNQISSYNMALEDRARARYAQMERPGEADDYISRNRLEK